MPHKVIALIAGAVLSLALAIGIGYAGGRIDAAQRLAAPQVAAAPEPDRVVGIEMQCFATVAGVQKRAHGWVACANVRNAAQGDASKVLTIRTPGGQTYQVEYGDEHDVRLGDPWPP